MFKGKLARIARAPVLAKVLALLLVLLPTVGLAVVRDYYFRTLDSRQGLVQNSVTAMLQDHEGFVWVATQGSLHRSNGYRFTALEDLVEDGTSLPSYAQALAESTVGVLYLGTLRDGLFQVDAQRRQVLRLEATSGTHVLPAGQIDALLYQPGVGLWIGSTEGVGRFDDKSGHFTRVLTFDASLTGGERSSISRRVRALALDSENNLWVGTRRSLYRIANDGSSAERVSVEGAGALLRDAAGTMWFGTPSGLGRQAPGAAHAETVWQPPAHADGDCCGVIALAQATDGAIWLSAERGQIWRYDPATRDAVAIPINPWIDGMLTEPGLPQMMIDRSNLLWLGSHASGVATTPATRTPFRAVFYAGPEHDPLTNNVVRAIQEGASGELWLGTQAGLSRYDPLGGGFEVFNHAFDPASSADPMGTAPSVMALVHGTEGYWLATNAGLFHFDTTTRRARAVPIEPGANTTAVRAIERSADGTLWASHGDQGLAHLGSDGSLLEFLPPRPGEEGAHHQNRVLVIKEDSRGRLWFGGLGGLSVRDPKSGRFSNFTHVSGNKDSLSNNIVRSILESRDGTIWIGSHGGLNQVVESDEGRLTFRHWSLGEDAASTVVYGIAEDAQGRLWLSGNDGVTRLDRQSAAVERFGMDAGLQDLEFNGSAVAMLRDGRIAFGGVRGFNLIDPAQVRPSAFEPPVVLTWIGAGEQAFSGQISRRVPVELDQQQRILSFGFAALDYTVPENNRFSYQLEGFDAQFSPPSTRPLAVYTNLAAGNYVFRVRATNHDGVWSGNELRVPIRVLAPWWRTGVAKIVYLLLGALLIGLLWRAQRQRVAQQANLLAQIREREDRLKLSLWGAGDSFWDWDLRSNNLYRLGSKQMTQAADEEILSTGQWQQHAIHPDDLPGVQKRMYEHLAGRTDAFESEHRIRNAYNEWVWVRSRGKVVERDAEFNPLRVAGTAHDVTSVRQAERERRIASEVLRSMNEAVAVIDLNLRFVSVNPAFSRITGYREQDVVGMPDSLLESSQHPPEFYRLAHQELKERGHFRSEVWLRRADGEEFLCWMEQSEVRDEKGVRSHFVSVLNDITDKKRAEQELRYLANYDTLTGLPNRSLLSERLSRAVVRARRHGSQIGVLFLDLDHFKVINDSLGHAAGDRILKASAARLLGVVGGSDTVARLGGDEFTIVMEEIVDRGAVIGMAEAVIAAFGEPLLDEGHADIVISPSIGIAICPEHAQVPTDLLKFADAAMYRAKERGRNTYQIYDPSMDAEVRRRASMTAALRRALDRGELYLEYQPRQSLFDNRISGVEALLRWNSEEFGQVEPSIFIPLAEETGLILPIGDWVLEEACRQLYDWRDLGVLDVSVAVNVSVLQLLRGGLAASVSRALQETGLPAHRLELELTESMVMANAEQTITILRDLKRIGVSIAIDDFGTGYSSLVYLKRLPIDTLKIDKEFVGDLTSDPDDEAITTTIITMAHSLGLTVIAEGVETREQLAYLRSQGCDEIQGFLLARPMGAATCLAFLMQQQAVQQRWSVG